MNKELKKYVVNLAIDQLMQSSWGDKLHRAMEIFESIQEHFMVLSEKQEKGNVTIVKAVTVATFAILKKIKNGTNLAGLKSEDWKEIADEVPKYAVLQDEQSYVVSIFDLYEKYIRFSISHVENFAPENIVNPILALADELQENRTHLEQGVIAEVVYIENCLWISAEAMIKLIASLSSRIPDQDYAEFAHAVAMYAFEYGRFLLYKREKVIVDEFIQSQCKLDKELEQKYVAYVADLEEQAQHFYVLIENAFLPDFRENFLHSITLAQAAGVTSEDILTDIEDIDKFFLD